MPREGTWSRQPTLADAHPEIARDWHPDNELDPETVLRGSGRRVLWRCATCGEEWEAVVTNRTYLGVGCPACRRTRVRPAFSLLYQAPWAATEYDIQANGAHPRDVRATSTTPAWWECLDCGHRWQAKVASRVRRRSICPKCAARRQAGRRKKPRA